MATYIHPAPLELRAIEQSLLPPMMDDPIFDILPIEETDDLDLAWDIEDDYIGLQQPRGLDGTPMLVKRVGSKRFLVEAGVYGEFIPLTESDILKSGRPGTFADHFDVTGQVMRYQKQLLTRRINLIKRIGWGLVTTGAYSLANAYGTIVHADQFTLQSQAVSVAWGTVATAKPLADFRAAKTKARGYSIDLGAGATAYMNQTTFNKMISNTNTNDLAGKRTSGLATVMGLADVNTVMLAEGLPRIVIYEGGYKDAAGTFQLFIPDDKVVIIGRRLDGAKIGNYRMTLNSVSGRGAYTEVLVSKDIPKVISVHDGHNGGPVLFYPSAIVGLTGV